MCTGALGVYMTARKRSDVMGLRAADVMPLHKQGRKTTGRYQRNLTQEHGQPLLQNCFPVQEGGASPFPDIQTQ